MTLKQLQERIQALLEKGADENCKVFMYSTNYSDSCYEEIEDCGYEDEDNRLYLFPKL